MHLYICHHLSGQPRLQITQMSSMRKNKAIKKQSEPSDLQVKKRSALRKQVKKMFFQRKYGSINNGLLHFLQKLKNQHVIASQSFNKAIRECSEFTCSICYNLIVFPVLLPCGHLFCRPCIEQAVLQRSRCCICRKLIQTQYFTVSQKINSTIISINVAALNINEKIRYWDRYCDYVTWQHLTMIDPNFKRGELVHFFDRRRQGWRYGVVTKVTVSKGKEVYFQVQPLCKQNIFECYKFHYLSRRVARFQFFFKAEKFMKEWDSNIANDPQPEMRDQMMREAVEKRIKNRTIRQSYIHWWDAMEKSNFSSLNSNVWKYLPPQLQCHGIERYSKVADYSFAHFHEQMYMTTGQPREEVLGGGAVNIEESFGQLGQENE